MARALTHSVASNSLAAAIRTHFGLTQAELGRYLQVSAGFVAHLEAGRKQASAAANQRLTRLALLLPPPEGFGPAAPMAAGYAPPAIAQPLFGPELPLPGPVATVSLEKRQRQCVRRLALLHRDLLALNGRLASHTRRRWALAVLPMALVPSPTYPVPAGAAEVAHLLQWVAELAASLPPAPTLRPDTPTTLTLLLLRLAATEAEAATLAQLLGQSST